MRDGAKLRQDSERFRRFSDQVFTISILSCLTACLLLAVTMFAVPWLGEYRPYLAVLALNIVFSALGVEWLYNIQEDYAYITLRNMLLRLFSLVLLFLFVRSEQDLLSYTAVSVSARIGTGILNYRNAGKYHRPRICRLTGTALRRHMPPILVLFAMSIATTIYVNSDVTILGFLCGDEAVGIYAVATRIYNTMKTILSAVIMVSIPHLSALLGEKKFPQFQKKAADIYKLLITGLFPLLVGVLVLRREFVWLISGPAFFSAVTPLTILCGAIVFSICGWFWGHCILIPLGREKIVLYATAAGAVANILLNFLLIPLWGVNAAAFTTLVAEAVQCAFAYTYGRKGTHIPEIWITVGKAFLGCAVIPAADQFAAFLDLGVVWHCLLVVFVSVPCYLLVQVLLKNDVIGNLSALRRS